MDLDHEFDPNGFADSEQLDEFMDERLRAERNNQVLSTNYGVMQILLSGFVEGPICL